jgi:hypothetical protein
LKLASFFSFDEAVLSFHSAPAPPASSRPTSHSQLFAHCTFLSFDLDYLSTIDNFKRLSKMLAQATHDALKEKMQVLKDLYTSRHYTQCTKFGERLLDEANDEVCEYGASSCKTTKGNRGHVRSRR